MPTNRSLNKVRVTRLFGTEGTIGLMDPLVNMEVKHGTETRWIKSLDSGNFQVALALDSGGTVIAKAYPHDLTVGTGVAAYFGWTSAYGAVGFGHSGVFPNGVSRTTNSGMAYNDGDGAITLFSRP